VRLRIVPQGSDTVTLWRDIHNAVIPAHALTSGQVLERMTCNSLTLAYDGVELVGNATIHEAWARDGSEPLYSRRTKTAFRLLPGNGFVEFDRYVLDGETAEYVEHYLQSEDRPGALHHHWGRCDGRCRASRNMDEVQDRSSPGNEEGAAGTVREISACQRADVGFTVSSRPSRRGRSTSVRRCRPGSERGVDRMGEDLDGNVSRGE
jgi:hypothetical protein